MQRKTEKDRQTTKTEIQRKKRHKIRIRQTKTKTEIHRRKKRQKNIERLSMVQLIQNKGGLEELIQSILPN